jgi:hypothetical protein
MQTIIASHREQASKLRDEAVGKRAHAEGYARTAAELDAKAADHERAADMIEACCSPPAPAPEHAPAAPPPEALMTEQADSGAGDYLAPEERAARVAAILDSGDEPQPFVIPTAGLADAKADPLAEKRARWINGPAE